MRHPCSLIPGLRDHEALLHLSARAIFATPAAQRRFRARAIFSIPAARLGQEMRPWTAWKGEGGCGGRGGSCGGRSGA
eukprot:9084593-Pyramimonas_sp.AAC.1